MDVDIWSKSANSNFRIHTFLVQTFLYFNCNHADRSSQKDNSLFTAIRQGVTVNSIQSNSLLNVNKTRHYTNQFVVALNVV